MEASEHDALSLSCEAEVARVGVEWPAGVEVSLDSIFVRAIENDLAECTVVVSVGDLDRVGAVHPRSEHFDGTTGNDTRQPMRRGYIFEAHD